MHPVRIQLAARHLKAGHTVAYPTEAVWGLGCDPFNRNAVLSLLQLKKRSPEKGMILVAASMQQIDSLLAPLGGRQRRTLERDWPGPVTWLIPDPLEQVPWWIKGRNTKVAVRVSAHPVVVSLSLAFGGPIISSSANRAGGRPARTRLQLMKAFGATIDHVLPGPLGGQEKPTRIRDLETGRIIR